MSFTKEQVIEFGAYVRTHEKVKAASNSVSLEPDLTVEQLFENFAGPKEFVADETFLENNPELKEVGVAVGDTIQTPSLEEENELDNAQKDPGVVSPE